MNENGQSEFLVMPNQSVASVTEVSLKKKKISSALFGVELICNDSERFTATVATELSPAIIEPICQKNTG